MSPAAQPSRCAPDEVCADAVACADAAACAFWLGEAVGVIVAVAVAVSVGVGVGVGRTTLLDPGPCCAASEARETDACPAGLAPPSAPEHAQASSPSTPSPAASANTRRRQYVPGSSGHELSLGTFGSIRRVCRTVAEFSRRPAGHSLSAVPRRRCAQAPYPSAVPNGPSAVPKRTPAASCRTSCMASPRRGRNGPLHPLWVRNGRLRTHECKDRC